LDEDPTHMSERQPEQGGSHYHVTRWLAVAMLAVVAAALLAAVLTTSPTAVAQAPGAAEDEGMLAVAGQISGETYGLYLIDRRSGVITMYEWQPTTRKLRLLAARNITFDLQLDEYNTEPSPSEIQSLVRLGQRLGSETRPVAGQ